MIAVSPVMVKSAAAVFCLSSGTNRSGTVGPAASQLPIFVFEMQVP